MTSLYNRAMRLRIAIPWCISRRPLAYREWATGLHRSRHRFHWCRAIGMAALALTLSFGPDPIDPVLETSSATEAFQTFPAHPVVGGGQAYPRSRASPQQVGTVMALLATFDEAGVLPPEGSAEANQLIKALIQFQTMFMKSAHPEVRRYFSQALERKLPQRASEAATVFHVNGWSSETLEAVVEFGTQRGNWDQQQFQEGLREFNLDLRDLDLLIRIFYDAQQSFISHGKELHQIYAAKRREMPGNRRESN